MYDALFLSIDSVWLLHQSSSSPILDQILCFHAQSGLILQPLICHLALLKFEVVLLECIVLSISLTNTFDVVDLRACVRRGGLQDSRCTDTSNFWTHQAMDDLLLWVSVLVLHSKVPHSLAG